MQRADHLLYALPDNPRAQQDHESNTPAVATTPDTPQCPSYSRLVEMSDARLRSMLYKNWRLSAETATESLVADTVSASSTAAGNIFVITLSIGQLGTQAHVKPVCAPYAFDTKCSQQQHQYWPLLACQEHVIAA